MLAGNKYTEYIYIYEGICLICSRDYKHLSSLKFMCFKLVLQINLLLFKFRIAFIFMYYKHKRVKFFFFFFFVEGLPGHHDLVQCNDYQKLKGKTYG